MAKILSEVRIVEYSTEFKVRVVAFDGWERLDGTLCTNKNEEGATVSALLYGALTVHIVAVKLFISGLLVPFGNTQRCCLECVAMPLLFSNPDLGFLSRYMSGRYSSIIAVRDVKRNASKLKLSKKHWNNLAPM